MTKTEQNRIMAWRLKVLHEAGAAPRNVTSLAVSSADPSRGLSCALLFWVFGRAFERPQSRCGHCLMSSLGSVDQTDSSMRFSKRLRVCTRPPTNSEANDGVGSTA
jgi:hypothetical protein